MRYFLFLLFIFSAFAEGTSDWQLELKQIDQQIVDLKEKQKLYKSQILRLQDNADRWQSESGRLGDARRAWKIVDEKKEKIIEAQDQINALQARKREILAEHPEAANAPSAVPP